MKYQSRGPDLDMDKCVDQAGGNRFDLVIMASARAREIKRKNADSLRHEHTHSVVTALEDFQNGVVGPEYIKRVK